MIDYAAILYSDWSSRSGSARGQYRLNHKNAGALLDEIRELRRVIKIAHTRAQGSCACVYCERSPLSAVEKP